jgi:hypothetical protein
LPEFLQNLDSLSSALLGSASKDGQKVLVKILLTMDGVELDLKDNNGWTPLQRAARNGYEATVRLLLEQGAESESKDSEGRMPLSWAAGSGYEAVIHLLLEQAPSSSQRTTRVGRRYRGLLGVDMRLLSTYCSTKHSRQRIAVSPNWATTERYVITWFLTSVTNRRRS